MYLKFFQIGSRMSEKNLLKIIFQNFNYFSIKNTYFELIRKKLYTHSIKKRKQLLLNSFYNSSLLQEFFGKKIDYDYFKKIFFNKQKEFAYWNSEQKNEIVVLLKREYIKQVSELLEQASKILKKEFKIFDLSIQFDSDIDWHYSFYKDINWELIPSDLIKIYDDHGKKDVKYIWELNRHQFLTYLGFAFYITGDENYAKAFKEIILNWIKTNPPLKGINWYSGLEISLRLISWIFTLFFFRDSKIINEITFFRKIFKSMFEHAYYLNYFYTRRSFNHTIGELFGLYLFTNVFKDIPKMRKWKDKIYKKLKNQIYIQTRKDGTNIEQSINYHKFTLEFFLLFYLMNESALENNYKIRLIKMVNFLRWALQPNNTAPNFGDSDNAKVLILTSHKNDNYDELLLLASISLEQEWIKCLFNKNSIVTILLLGIKAHEIFNSYKISKIKEKFAYFPEAGYLIMKDGWDSKSNYLFIKFSKFGPQMAPHSHSDLTQILFTCNGKEIFIDSGTYSYNKDWNCRKEFTRASSHNVLVIDKLNQAKLLDYFYWIEKPKIKREFKLHNDDIYFKCLHDGYDGFIVKRELLIDSNLKKIKIIDTVYKKRLNSKKTHLIQIYYHLGEDVSVFIKKNSILIDNKIRMNFLSPAKLKIDLKNTVFSPYYGFLKKNKALVINAVDIENLNEKFSIITEIIQLK